MKNNWISVTIVILLTLVLSVSLLFSLISNNGQEKIRVKRSNSLLSVDDLFISVKTSGKFHRDRLPLIIKTWFQLAPKQVEKSMSYYFTD